MTAPAVVYGHALEREVEIQMDVDNEQTMFNLTWEDSHKTCKERRVVLLLSHTQHSTEDF